MPTRSSKADFIGSGVHVKEGSPAQNAEAFKVPVLMFHGDMDLNVDIGQSRFMDKQLKKAGKSSELIVYPDLEHSLLDGTVRAGHAAQVRRLPAQAAQALITQREPGGAARIERAVEAHARHRFRVERRRADQDRGDVIFRRRHGELVPHAEDGLRVRAQRARLHERVASGIHCWWMRGAATASWMSMP
jgi:hypothetical protein